MVVYEIWTKAGSPTEHEVTLTVPAASIPRRGSALEIPGLGRTSVESSYVLQVGDRELPDPSEVIVRLDVTTEPDR